MGYVTIDLEITSSPTESGLYQVDASIRGVTSAFKHERKVLEEKISIDLEKWEDLDNALKSLKARGPREEIQIRDLGEYLFQQVLKEKVYTLYKYGKEFASTRGHVLRLRLHLEPPELIELPWECLYDEGEFLGLAKGNPRILITRCPIEVTPVKTTEERVTLQIMIMTAEPSGYDADAKKEKERIKEALKEVEKEGYISLKEVSGTDVELEYIYKNRTLDIFHFIGHGNFNDANREGELILEDAHRQPKTISARKFSTSLPNSVKLVFLNACESARGNAHIRFANTAQILAKQGHVVIAMQFRISTNAAVRFADIFYSEIARGKAVDEAVAEARQRVFTMASCNPLDWAAPVLYMKLKSDDGILFNIKNPSPPIETSDEEETETIEEQTTVSSSGSETTSATPQPETEDSSNNAVDHYNIGNALFAEKRYEEALAAYEQVVHLDPQNAAAYRGKGNALSELGRLQEAGKAYRQAKRLSIETGGRW